jgi:hypothetical protein
LSAAIITAGEDPGLFGDLNQHNTACNNVACGPTAATNSFVFLQNMYPATYGTSLVPHVPGGDFAQDEMDVADQLSTLMHTCNLCNPGAGGTFIEDFIAGKQQYMESVAANMTIYAAQINFAWRTTDPDGNNVGPKPGYVMDNTVPTANFIASEIAAGEDVEVFLAGDVDHYITLFGITFDTVTKTGDIEYIDPDTGTVGISNITGMNVNGFLQIAYGANSEVIAHAVSESPVPEPAGMLLFGAGLLIIVALKTGFQPACHERHAAQREQ